MKCVEASTGPLRFDQPHLWGVLNAPATALESPHWYDWCAMLAAFEDSGDDIDWTADDLQPLVDCWRALKRRGVSFDWPLENALCSLFRDVIAICA